MVDSVSVASEALVILGANTINAFSDETAEGEVVNLLYTSHIEHLLSIHPWTFATKKRQLSQDTTDPINEYAYSHIVPAETLLIWALFPSDGVGVSPVNDYDIYTAGTSRRIFSNYSTLYADYTYYADENTWPAYFRQFAVYSLASHLAVPLTRNIELQKYCEQIAYGSLSANRKGGLYGVAAATEAKQKRNEFIISSPFTTARFGSA